MSHMPYGADRCTPMTAEDPPGTESDQALKAYMAGEFTRAAELLTGQAVYGNASAEFSLGTLYEKGLGGEANPAQSLEWYRKSAGNGFKDAPLNQTANQGDAPAQLHLTATPHRGPRGSSGPAAGGALVSHGGGQETQTHGVVNTV